MLNLSWWEQLILGMVVSFLTALEPKLTNPTERAALQAALEFLQSLLSGTVAVTADAARPKP